jgi:hypothetical protein
MDYEQNMKKTNDHKGKHFYNAVKNILEWEEQMEVAYKYV